MKPFSENIVSRLNSLAGGECIDWIGLGRHDFQFAFEGVRGSCTNKVSFSLAGEMYLWDEGPIHAPVWTLVGQTPTGFELMDELTLRVRLSSCDFVELISDCSAYEAVVIEFVGSNGSAEAEVF